LALLTVKGWQGHLNWNNKMVEETLNPNLNGPESIPLKEYNKFFPLVINIYNLKDDQLIRTEKIDYGNYEHRKWLGRITYFACTNGMSVETMAAKDSDG
jgi:hypothetical protein